MTRAIIAVAFIGIIVIFAYLRGGAENRLQDEIDYRDTIERMDDATDDSLDDVGVIDSLRELAK